MDKEFTVAKWLLIFRPKKTQSHSKKIQPKMCVQAQKFESFENSSLWVSVVSGRLDTYVNLLTIMSSFREPFVWHCISYHGNVGYILCIHNTYVSLTFNQDYHRNGMVVVSYMQGWRKVQKSVVVFGVGGWNFWHNSFPFLISFLYVFTKCFLFFCFWGGSIKSPLQVPPAGSAWRQF